MPPPRSISDRLLKKKKDQPVLRKNQINSYLRLKLILLIYIYNLLENERLRFSLLLYSIYFLFYSILFYILIKRIKWGDQL
jgi:hypothetical protein